MNYLFFLILITIINLNLYATESSYYSISVCTTSNLEGANTCKNNIEKYTNQKIFILIDKKDKKYRTYLGEYKSYSIAKESFNSLSKNIIKYGPFIKKIQSSSNNKNIKSNSLNLESKYIKEWIDFYNNIIQSNTKKTLKSISNYDKLIIEVNSNTNMMTLKGKKKNLLDDLKTYKVSTARKDIEKPLGIGNISSISLTPSWFPTENTKKAFEKKGISLPSIVPYKHKLNYMGAAKINLTHKVNGREVYRIHGTLDESTIGTNESSGCIRMKNDEVVQLAQLLTDYTKYKSFNDIKVILK